MPTVGVPRPPSSSYQATTGEPVGLVTAISAPIAIPDQFEIGSSSHTNRYRQQFDHCRKYAKERRRHISGGSSGSDNVIGGIPMLGPLANNGGQTQTMLPQAGSPAIDAGNDANCPATDQRGVSRPQGVHCDIGAVELVTDRKFADNFDGTPTP